jgi:predicted nucleic acid-binding protein
MVEILTCTLFAIIIVFAFSGKHKRYGDSKSDSEEIRKLFEYSAKRRHQEYEEMKIRQYEIENHITVSDEVRKEREKTWIYFDKG